MSDTSDLFSLQRGDSPLVISFPHVGTTIPADQHARYTPRALQAEDTDWFVDRLFGFAGALGATLLVPRYSRYLIDLNRSRENRPMYPGLNNTELCPTRHFTGEPLYRAGCAPDDSEIARRIAQYWQPHHDALQAELTRCRAAHGHAVLLDAHSIQSELPWLFEGQLPHMNIGTADGSSCATALRTEVAAVFADQADYSHALDGRFKGGHITRHYGQPATQVHAVQLEMCWRAYLDESQPAVWDAARAAAATPLLRRLVLTLRDWAPA